MAAYVFDGGRKVDGVKVYPAQSGQPCQRGSSMIPEVQRVVMLVDVRGYLRLEVDFLSGL